MNISGTTIAIGLSTALFAGAAHAEPTQRTDTYTANTGNLQMTVGWAAVGVGTGALVLGGIATGVALDDWTPSSQCSSCQKRAVTWIDVATVGYIAGVIAAATGVVLLLTLPKTTTTLEVHAGAVAITARF